MEHFSFLSFIHSLYPSVQVQKINRPKNEQEREKREEKRKKMVEWINANALASYIGKIVSDSS